MAYNASGGGISGLDLVFTVDDPTLGYVTETATTGADGTATTTFTARSNPGTVNVTATSTSGEISSDARAVTILDQTAPGNISLAANPTAVTATNTSTITATVTDSSGAPVDNGTTVTFEVANSTYGSITASATTNSGTASATFTASNNAGTATINASSGSATASINVTINPVSAASIEFDSVSKNPVAIRGGGGQEHSVITFNVIDVNGNPAEDVDVLFTMSGPGGAEYIEDDDATPYTQTVGTSNGVAAITFHSGYEPGAVTINASITTAGGTTITASTPVISIGGGVPTDRWFTVSVSEPGWNMGGLECVGVETDITAWLADRFGNYNVLDGHTVSFESEVGLAVNPSAITSGATGTATSTVRTQSATNAPKDVVPETWEEDLVDDLDDNAVGDYGQATSWGYPLPSGHPRDGVCNVLVFTRGEESFEDGIPVGTGVINGQYDAGEDYDDTADDPWRDYDDDGLWDDGTATTPLTTAVGSNPAEDGFVDRDGNSLWDGVNGSWDSDKYLFRQVDFLITGSPLVRFSKDFFTVANGGTDTVNILVCDINYNPLSAGSTVSISVDKGDIVGGRTSYTYPSSSAYGSETTIDWDADGDVDNDDYRLFHRNLIEYVIVIGDDDPTDGAGDPKQAKLEITVNWASNGDCEDVTISSSINGTVD
ncbi:MAG: Ig-like domain-containing protein [Thermodesulfobacteriota bacterium]|nr:Ig-like domain-containing protein [Thermodesulfobacteriota bacterium]